MSDGRVSRRGFLRDSLTTAAAFTIVPRHVLGGNGHTPPSDTLTQAVVGVGGMGTGHLNSVLHDRGSKLLAVCDVDAQRLARAVAKGGEGCQGYKDFRDVLDRGDVDVVRIATPPHWHALISIAAARAGCDVWCEKPVTRTIAESHAVVEAVQSYGRMFRINTWFRFSGGLYGFGSTAKPLKKLVSGGLLGWPLTVRVSPSTGFHWKVKGHSGRTGLKPEPVPSHFDYDMWLGPAPFKPYCRARTHYRFRGYWDYDAGGLGDMGQHYLDPVQYILDKDHTSPVEVEAHAPWPQHPDAVGYWGRVEMTYEDGCRIIIESGEGGGRQTEGKPYIEGPKGKIYRGFRTDPPDLKDALDTLPDPEPMITNFTTSVRTRRKFALDEVKARRSIILVHLASTAMRTGRKLRFDPAAMRFVGDDEANRLADQPMRAPWHL